MDVAWNPNHKHHFCSFQTIPLILETSTTVAEIAKVHATQTPQPMQFHQKPSFDFFAIH